jgi:hypothetical protein
MPSMDNGLGGSLEEPIEKSAFASELVGLSGTLDESSAAPDQSQENNQGYKSLLKFNKLAF